MNYWSEDKVKSYFKLKGPSEQLLTLLDSGYLGFPKSVLDAGCGYGRNLIPFINRSIQLRAFDPCKEAVEFSIEQFRDENNASILIGELPTHPFEKEIFDLIICDGVLHQLLTNDEYHLSLFKMRQSLAKGGRLYLSVFTDTPQPTLASMISPCIWKTVDGMYMHMKGVDDILLAISTVGLRTIWQKTTSFKLPVGLRGNLSVVLESAT